MGAKKVIVKDYWDGYPYASFEDACEGEQTFEYDGTDYIILADGSGSGWYVSYLNDYALTGKRPLDVVCGPADTPFALMRLPFSDGKSIKELYADIRAFEYNLEKPAREGDV